VKFSPAQFPVFGSALPIENVTSMVPFPEIKSTVSYEIVISFVVPKFEKKMESDMLDS
jgi:hypothetical protein